MSVTNQVTVTTSGYDASLTYLWTAARARSSGVTQNPSVDEEGDNEAGDTEKEGAWGGVVTVKLSAVTALWKLSPSPPHCNAARDTGHR